MSIFCRYAWYESHDWAWSPAPEDDIKLGAGGIREIEFIASSLFTADLNASYKIVSVSRAHWRSRLVRKAGGIRAAYLFLRRVEHAIQALNDLSYYQKKWS